eukprot:TRINITY_DN27249_c0_g1_i1.p1 TRINITY_DN27249_c0_g1~~TRINITY_DN27249_c0_g1_i1.p1  ORF type:complete len:107 (+),score=17.36 TRINITY_DN27249_c0_g1_i1:538-858(+)
MDVLNTLETDAIAVAEDLTKMIEELRKGLAEATANSVEHMQCHSEVAGELQTATLEAASRGNRFVNECLRLNEEMRDVGQVAARIKVLRQRLDQFEAQASRYLPRT